ncbi:AraC family transcriptional regulator [Paenibacillus sophorae]|uniref:AraC family transcriptional regulator n=1 Tax=Paenibacillus sophorae TaxID=1333845 RepID=A0ABX8HKY3_9BACL|nr:AraC family transcriptional regulator [Paenibacillus sophorae]
MFPRLILTGSISTQILLLLFTPRPITVILLGVKFYSLDYFTRQFSDYYGTTPSQYRKLHR